MILWLATWGHYFIAPFVPVEGNLIVCEPVHTMIVRMRTRRSDSLIGPWPLNRSFSKPRTGLGLHLQCGLHPPTPLILFRP